MEKTYRISGGGDGADYGYWRAETPWDAVKALLEDAGLDDDPNMDAWYVEEADEREED